MTQAPNAQRGESSFTIGGQTYLLRPSFSALVAAEDELGSLFALVDRAAEGLMTLQEMTALIWHSLPASTRPEREKVGSTVLEMGLLEAAKPVRVILSQVLRGIE